VILPAVAVAAGTLSVGLVAAAGLRRLPTLRWQLTALALLAVLLPLGAVLVSGAVMFESGHDLTVLAAVVAGAAGALVAAVAVVRWIEEPIQRLRRASTALARGDLSARAPTQGPQEIAELAGAFNGMAERLEDLFDARRELVVWASHDLRTPLAAMRAMIEAIEDGIVPAERYVPELREQARLLAMLVDDLFELARIDAGALTLEIEAARLDGLVERCLRGLQAEAASRNVTLGAEIPADTPAVRCAPDSVSRVLFNLVANALRHTPGDGVVAVRVAADRDEVVVAVEDTGEGFTPEGQARAFERFWRGDRARSRAQGGAGLGLAIARGLVEAQGGRIWVENRPGGGARISFTLPAA
jgi:signal transduction histidine kinase